MHVRMVATELKSNVAALKAAVDDLATDVDAMHAITDAWVVNGVDGDLPAGLAVQGVLTDYDALLINLSKPANTINDSLAAVRALTE